MNLTNWLMFMSNTYKKPYYYNSMTNESQWEKPSDSEKIHVTAPWESVLSSKGQYFFYNISTLKTQWRFPFNNQCKKRSCMERQQLLYGQYFPKFIRYREYCFS